ncbi:MAG: class I SAM-dependent methyltransferase [Crocinitomicaceae bacterium]|nr:class I SAM-dependent methyltransferase [Crocinitomicaceae bacterium]
MDRSERFWNKRAKDFDKRDNPNSAIRKEKYEKIRNHLKPTAIVLDFGCATGSLSRELAQDVQHVDGLDISSKMIEIAKQKANTSCIENVSYFHDNLVENKLLERKYDVVLAFYVLHLVEHPTQTLNAINDILKPGGLLITESPCLATTNRIWTGLLKGFTKLAGLPYLHKFSANTLQEMFVEQGFEIIEHETTNGSTVAVFSILKKGDN